MARPTFIDDKGRRFTLGVELGRGGEASVWSLESQPALVAKVYHQAPSMEKAEKLCRMVEHQSDRLLALSAWPVGTLFTPDTKSLAGFLMKNVNGFKDIHLLYNPKSRTREFPPKANWRFLIHTAANVARAFSVIHDNGHVIGDVNQSNLRVSPETAIVNLIDCDSFQISSNGKLYPCEVGVPLYTPPELQEIEFRDVVRTPNHDNFGLAVLIFHLLLMGRHPFAGKFLGRGEMPIEKAIAENRFAFAPDVQRTQMLPPPSCLTLAQLPEGMADLFIHAFSPGGVRGARPDGRKWIAALGALSSHLMVCAANKAHLFFSGLPTCPWCSIEATGVLLFVDYVIVDTGSTFNLEIAWSQILAVPNPGAPNLPSIRSLASIVEPSPQARAAARRQRYKTAAIAIAAVATLAYVLLSDNGFAVMYLVGTIFGLFRAAFAAFRTDSGSTFARVARDAEARLRALEHRWQREASGESFSFELDVLRSLAEEYRRLPEKRNQKVRELERALYSAQLHHYLEQFDIASAEIPHIKDGRKAMLSSYGIDDAADITQAAVDAVPGFGGILASQLIAWRSSLEVGFRFSPGRGVDPADLQRVDKEIANRRAEIEPLLIKGPADLNRLAKQILASRLLLQNQLQKAQMDLAQAQIDEIAAA